MSVSSDVTVALLLEFPCFLMFKFHDGQGKHLFNLLHRTLTRKASLAGVAQWIECQPVNQRVAGSIPSQDTCLGYGPRPRLGACERQSHIDVSFPL